MITDKVFFSLMITACLTLLHDVVFRTLASMVGDGEDSGLIVEDTEYRLEEKVSHFHPECQIYTNKGLLCLVGWMSRVIIQGQKFYCFQNGEIAAQFLILKIVQR